MKVFLIYLSNWYSFTIVFLLRQHSTIAVLAKNRIVRDPIYGFISLSHYDFIQEIVDTAYFQRLRRLCQLGVSAYVYPGATHSRLSHVLGAMELFTRVYDNLTRDTSESAEQTLKARKLGAAAVLLHDIGHGPLSHASEAIFDFKHVAITNAIIRETEIGDILSKSDIEPSEVTDIISRISPEHTILTQLTSSQLDLDRLDYLARDMYFTGVGFGRIDSERITRMMQIYKAPGSPIHGHVVTNNKGLFSLESYILSRHLMHEAVYFHKATRCIELMIKSLFQRAKWLAQEKGFELPAEIQLLSQPNGVDWKAIVGLDDHIIFSIILKWMKNDDPILKDLSTRIIDRKLLKGIEIPQTAIRKYVDSIKKIEKALIDSGFDPAYYTTLDDPKHLPYSPYSPKAPDDKTTVITNIFVLDSFGKPKEISQLSPTVEALAKYQYNFRLYVPDKCLAQTLSTLDMEGE